MDASVKKLLTDIGKKKFHPVYVLQGEEDYYIDLVANALEINVLEEQERSFNQVVLYGKDVTVAALLNHAKRFPMMADRQLVLVREAQEISDLNKEMGTKLMLSYINNPAPSTVLVLCHKHKSLDRRRELGKKFDAQGFLFTFAKLRQYQVPEFAQAYFDDRGFSIEPNAVHMLCEYVGTDLNRLVNEIDKLLIGQSSSAKITTEFVMARVGISREYNNFELQKAILLRQVPKVFEIVQYFQANTKRNPVIVTVALLFSFFNKLLAATAAKDKSERGLVTELKISPYQAKDFAQGLGLYSTGQIQQAIHLLKTADLRLKGVNVGSSEDDGQILQELVIRIMR